MTKIIQKTYSVEANIEANQMKGTANVMGILDQGDDVTFPGFFKDALPDFRKNGFVPLGHAWEKLPVAMPTKAEEQGADLYTEALFHSTKDAQDARTVCLERKEHGLNMGLSVGFSTKVDGQKWFANGVELLAYAKKIGCDMSFFDTDGITAHKRQCRGLLPGGCAKLFEYSITPAPMNTQSVITGVKSMREGSMPEWTADSKSQYLGDIERSISCACVQRVQSALMSLVYKVLYNLGPDDTLETIIAQLTPAFDEARDLSISSLQALLTLVDFDELREDAQPYYAYYSATETEQKEIQFSQRLERLVTDVQAFNAMATRRQEVRQKSGRTFSQSNIDKMRAAHEAICEGAGKIKEMLDTTEPAAEDDTSKSLKRLQEMYRSQALVNDAQRQSFAVVEN